MPTLDTRLGTLDEVLSGKPDHVVETFGVLRAMILAVHPDAVETPSPGENAVTYGLGPRKMKDGYAYLMPLDARVNLGFFQGTLLPDPYGLLEGTGKTLRHVKVTTKANAARTELADLVRAAVEERRTATGRRQAPAALPAPSGR